MDKLQWFKFTPSDWMMGKIQRCPEVTQARFMRLSCLYWNKECLLNYEDAEIEIDKEHLDILINKKIIKLEDNFIKIEFLDEQFREIESVKEDKSASAKIGNLKRWHRDVYNRFIKNEISLDDALVIAYQSHPDCTPIAPQSQNIAEKSREEEKREEKKREENSIFSFEDFWHIYPVKTGKIESEKKYKKISEKDRLIIKNSINNFVKNKPFKDYTHPNPTTYINQKRWLDNVEQTTKEIPPFEFDFKKHGGDINLFNKLKLEHERKYS